MYNYRAVLGILSNISVPSWGWLNKFLSVQEAVYHFDSRTVFVLVCSAFSTWEDDVLSNVRNLGAVLGAVLGTAMHLRDCY